MKARVMIIPYLSICLEPSLVQLAGCYHYYYYSALLSLLLSMIIFIAIALIIMCQGDLHSPREI